MELWGIVFGACLGLIFYVTLTLYREIKYIMPTLMKNYEKSKYKIRHCFEQDAPQ
jgi:uncharacterized protein YneF (UPF0154 family)